MQQIVIAGGGGFGLQIAQYLLSDAASGQLRGYAIKGVIDDTFAESPSLPYFPLPYLGSIVDYRPDQEDVLLIAIGSPRGRRIVHRNLLKAGARFMTYVHPSSYVAADAELGEGVVIFPNSVINSKVVVGAFSVINVFCSIGHGAAIGEFSVLSPYAALNGDARIGSDCFLGTRATVFPCVSMGNLCVVDTHAYVKAKTGDRKIVSVRGNYVVLDNRLA